MTGSAPAPPRRRPAARPRRLHRPPRDAAAFADALDALGAAYGAQDGWWPVDRAWHVRHGTDARFQVCVGAVLTQNTSWRGVEAAIARLKERRLLDPRALAEAPPGDVEEAVRPAGTFRVKAAYLQGLARAVREGGGLDAWLDGALDAARTRLLALPGIGPETADAILLYAMGRPTFVIDAYTRRIGRRLGITHGREPYHDLQRLWAAARPASTAAYQQAHALLVEHAKRTCLARRPACGSCVLQASCARVDVDGAPSRPPP